VKTGKNISYPEARKLVLARTPKPGVSYAAAAFSKPTKSVGTQTNPTNKTKDRAKANIENEANKPKSKSKPVQSPNKINVPSNKYAKRTRTKKSKLSEFKAPTTLKYTRKDFLKNRPNIDLLPGEAEEALKVYLSPEEDMFTDGTSESDVDVSTSAPC
jgi:hypothetical protein